MLPQQSGIAQILPALLPSLGSQMTSILKLQVNSLNKPNLESFTKILSDNLRLWPANKAVCQIVKASLQLKILCKEAKLDIYFDPIKHFTLRKTQQLL